MKLLWIALVSFCFAFLILSAIWINNDMLDETVWQRRVHHMHHDLRDTQMEFLQPLYSGHPGTPIILGGVVASLLGIPEDEIIGLTVAALNAALIAGIAVAAKRAWPHSQWWIAASALVLFQPFALRSTPTHIVASSATVLFIILVLAVLQRSSNYQKLLVVAALALGFSLATRLPETVLLTAPFVVLLWVHIRTAKLLLVGGLTLATLIALDPFLWQTPVEHIQHMIARGNVKYSQTLEPDNPFAYLPQFAALGAAGFVLAGVTVAMYARRDLRTPVSAKFVVALYAATALLCAALVTADSRSTRYFYPLFVIWEVFLALSLLLLVARVQSSSKREEDLFRWGIIQRYGPIVFVVSAQLLLFEYASTINYEFLLTKTVGN